MPKPAAHVLIWSAEHQCYLLHTLDHPPQSIFLGDEGAWQTWLMMHSSFSFQGQQGRLNVFKEVRPRGKGYWYAYHTSSGQTRKRYLGPDARVSLARLEEIAQSVKRDKREQTVRSLHMAPPPISWQTTQADFASPASMVASADEFNDSGMMVMSRLSPPHLPTTLVVRERLLLALDTALSRPLTLLSASAGWGKTTLLSAWAQRQQGPVAWLSLEGLDNDPTRFWISLTAALHRCWPEIGERALALLQDGHLSAGVTMRLNELTDRSAQTSPILLILDDYHMINVTTIHASLTFFLEHLPPRVHLLLASRVDPDLPLARLHARSQMREMRDSDLRFTQEETQRFLTQSMDLVLSKADIAVLQTHTEGWIAGLQLAALVLQKQTAPSAYVSTLSGSDRFLLDYMRDEILADLPPPLQDFLLQTSGLSRLSASLCDAVTGRNDSEFLLEQVMRANLFLQALPGEHPWYRYHALWTQALQHEARRRLGKATMQVLSRQASAWYEFPLLEQQEEALLLARFHIAQQQEEIALQALASWKEKAQAQGRKRSFLEILILEALAHAACKEPLQATSALLQALRLAHAENFQRLFLDEGEAMKRLLKTLPPLLRETSLVSFVQSLLRAFPEGPGAQSPEEVVPPGEALLPLEPLSDQEKRVLRLLIMGRSNSEIANALVVSINTVKTHVQSLYRKLGVHNRVEASLVARRLSLL